MMGGGVVPPQGNLSSVYQLSKAFFVGEGRGEFL